MNDEQYQAVIEELCRQCDSLRSQLRESEEQLRVARVAIMATLDENRHLADGDDCTLAKLKRIVCLNAATGGEGGMKRECSAFILPQFPWEQGKWTIRVVIPGIDKDGAVWLETTIERETQQEAGALLSEIVDNLPNVKQRKEEK